MSRKKKANTVIHILVDKSYSMLSCLQATIEGFNGYITNLQKEKGSNKTLVSFSLFDSHSYETLHTMVRPNKIPDLNNDVYQPRGSTPLWDAVGETIVDTEKDLKRVEGDPNILIVILTDGEENASRSYKSDEIKAMVTEREERGWSFIYLGANQDAWAVGNTLGISRGNTMTYDTANMAETIAVASAGTTEYMKKSMVARSAGVKSYKEETFFDDALKKIRDDNKA